MTLHILWKAVSSHLFLWPTVCKWHCTFCERQSHHIFSYNQQGVSDIEHLVKTVSSHIFLWPTGCEWQSTFCERQSPPIFSHDQKQVSDILLSKEVSLHLFLWPIASQWHCTFVKGSLSHLFLYDQQEVSDFAHVMVVKGSLITSFPMSTSMWVTLHIYMLWKVVSSHHFLWSTASEWHCTFCEKSHHIFLYDPQFVSNIAHFLKDSLTTSFSMTNRKWETLHILWKATSHTPHLFLWLIGSEWHCTFMKDSLFTSFSYAQQVVSDIAHFVKSSLITSFPMTNRKSVTLNILQEALLSHLFLWPTVSEWHCTFCERHSHHIFSYDQQQVSDITHFVKSSLITSFTMINSLWVTLHIVWKAVSLYLLLWPTASEWHCTFCERQSHHINSMWVTLHILWKAVSFIASFPMTNSMWVTLHILWKAVLSHLFLWPTVCEWHCTFCERQSHPIFSYGQQQVSGIAHFVKWSLITSLLWPTVCEWHCTFCEKQSHHTFFPMTNSEWVALHISWKAVSSHLFLWPIGSERHCTFCEM